jgi:hypothetical protein
MESLNIDLSFPARRGGAQKAHPAEPAKRDTVKTASGAELAQVIGAELEVVW